jgi:hypothetical protein
VTTFSQLVDEMIRETKRPDLATEIATYLNQTIREVHFEPTRGNVVHYGENRREAQVIATVESGEIWDIPNPAIFQGVEAIRFLDWGLRAGSDYAQEATPGPMLSSKPFFWYRSGPSLVFGGTQGYGGIGGVIQLSYFEYPASLKYKTALLREATYDVESGWTYQTVDAVDYGSTAELQTTARARVSNWLLLRWADVLKEGLRAKVYKRLSDDVRQRTSYSLYQQLRQGLYSSEVAELGVG